MTNSISSNMAGLSFCLEQSIGVLPTTPVWDKLEPNSFGDFGAQYTQVARNPIKPNRQRAKGVLTDVEATVNFQTDFLGRQLSELLSGYCFAEWRKKPSTSPTAVSSTAYSTSPTGFFIGGLVFASGFSVAANNGLKLITDIDGSTISADGLAVEATPPAAANLISIGVRGEVDDLTLTVDVNGAVLNSVMLDFTTLGCIPGEWVFLGGDDADNAFDTAANNGYYKIKSIATNAIVFDQHPEGIATDDGADKLIDIYTAHVLKNENDPALITKKSYQFERVYTDMMYEYTRGCVANSLDLNIVTANKVTCEMGFVALGAEDATAAKSGTRNDLITSPAFNGSSDIMQFKLYDDHGNNLSSYVTDLKLSIKNNAEALKAVGHLGGFDINVGDFMVSGTLTVYFVNNLAINALRNNYTAGLSFIMGQPTNHNGWVLDIPSLTLGDGKKAVEKDKPITIPLSLEASAHELYDYTLLMQEFTFLPQIAYN